MGFPKTGLEAVFLTQAFNKGFGEYQKGMAQAGKLAQTTATSITQSGSSIGGSFGGAIASAAPVIGGISLGIAALAAAAVGATVAVTGLAVGLGALANQAAPLEGVSFAFDRMAGSIVSLQALRDAAAGTISDLDLMKRANLALVGTTGEFRTQFAEALPRLLEGARAAAKATGQDINYLFESLVVGVKRSSPRLIDNTGIVLKLGESAEAMAASIGKSADEMTSADQQIAVLRSTLEGIDNIMLATAGSAEGLTDKQSRFQATMQNITQTLGLYFLPAAKTVQDAINGIAAAFLEAISPGGKLYGVLVNLGAVAKLAADAFSDLMTAAINALNGTTNEMQTGFAKLVSDFFEWGVEIVFSLADGIIQGAAAAINAVADAINGLLSFWFAPGSPPRVAPDLDKWGAAAMEAYLQGFTQADFTQLKDLQGPLKSVFDLFVDQGKLAKDAASKLWADVSIAMIKGLDSGNLANVIEKIKSTAGEYAGALINLIRQNQALAKATGEVKAAETALEASRKKATALDSKRAKLISEYNQLIREGASRETLAAKLAEINATEQAQAATLEEVKANELRVETAKEQMESVKEQVELAKQLIATMTEIAKAQAVQPEKKTAAAGAGVKAGGGGDLDLPTIDPATLGQTLSDTIANAIEMARLNLKIKWNEMWYELGQQFKPITDALANLQTALDNAEIAWGEFTTNFRATWDGFIGPFTENWNLAWNQLMANFELVLDTIGLVFEGWGQLFSGDWEGLKTTILEIWGNIWSGAVDNFETFKKIMSNNFGAMKKIGGNIIQGFWDGLKSKWESVMDWLREAARKLITLVVEAFQVHSPSRVFMDIGKNISLGMAQGIALGNRDVSAAMSSLIGASVRPVMASSPVSTNTSYNSTVNMGGVTLSNSMSMAEFENMLNRVISRSR